MGLGLGRTSPTGSRTPRLSDGRSTTSPHPNVTAKKELVAPMPPRGVARAIALFNFNAVQAGDLSFKKGQVITITEKSNDTNTWYVVH